MALPTLCCSCWAGRWWEFPLDTQGLTHIQLEIKKGHILFSGSTKHRHSHHQQWPESTAGAGASPSVVPGGKVGEHREQKGSLQPPRLMAAQRSQSSRAQSQINAPTQDHTGGRWKMVGYRHHSLACQEMKPPRDYFIINSVSTMNQ